MSLDNERLAAVFDEVASALAYQGEAWVKVRAYAQFAASMRERSEPVAPLVEAGRLQELPGVGKAIAKKVAEYAAHGTFPLLDRVRAEVPAEIRALLASGLPPSVVRHLQGRGLSSSAEVRTAVATGRLQLGEVPARMRRPLQAWLEGGSAS